MSTAAAIAAQRYQLLDAGWNTVPVSPRDKGCYLTGWPTIETSEHHIESWNRTNPAHTNTGFVTNRNYFAVDADTRDKQLTDRVVGAAFEHLGYTPFIRVGQAPKALLVYQKETPFSVGTSRFKFQGCDGDGLEILSGSKGANGVWSGAVFTAFGTHPETGQSYKWVGEANPLEDTPADAPVAAQKQVDAFIETVRGFAPFTVNPRGAANTDSARNYNADGYVTDGRENLMRDCIYQAACEIMRTGDVLDARGIAVCGWELFESKAWNGDGKWAFKDALSRARAIVRRIRDGIVTFGNSDLPQAIYFYADKMRSLGERARELLHERFCFYANHAELSPTQRSHAHA